MTKLVRKPAVYLAIALLVSTSCMAAAMTEFPVIGDNGDAVNEDRCPPGQWLIGLQGRTGAWVDQLQMICAPFDANGIQGNFWYGPVRGGNGGGPVEFTCPRDAVAYSVSFMFQSMRQVSQILVKCGSMRADVQTQFLFDNGHHGDQLDTSLYDGPWTQTCPDGESPVGFRINSGRAVNALGLRCDRRAP